MKDVPESVLSARAGFEHSSGWNNYAVFKYIDEMCVTTGCNRTNAAFSKTESLFVMDFISKYELAADTNLFFKIENVFDDQKIVSRAPDGARPNKPRTISAGLRMDF